MNEGMTGLLWREEPFVPSLKKWILSEHVFHPYAIDLNSFIPTFPHIQTSKKGVKPDTSHSQEITDFDKYSSIKVKV